LTEKGKATKGSKTSREKTIGDSERGNPSDQFAAKDEPSSDLFEAILTCRVGQKIRSLHTVLARTNNLVNRHQIKMIMGHESNRNMVKGPK
jgi:hypothetical protein